MDFLGYKAVLLIIGAGASIGVWAFAVGVVLDVIEKIQNSHPFQRRVKAKEAAATARGSKYVVDGIAASIKGIAASYHGRGEEDSAMIVQEVLLKLSKNYHGFR